MLTCPPGTARLGPDWCAVRSPEAAAVPGAQVAGVGAQRALAGDLGRVHLPRALLPGGLPLQDAPRRALGAGCCHATDPSHDTAVMPKQSSLRREVKEYA